MIQIYASVKLWITIMHFQHLLWLSESLVLNPTYPKGNLSVQAGHLTVHLVFYLYLLSDAWK